MAFKITFNLHLKILEITEHKKNVIFLTIFNLDFESLEINFQRVFLRLKLYSN